MKKNQTDIVLLTYAGKSYEKSAHTLERRAKSLGFSDVKVFGPSNLSSEFFAKNVETFTLSRGAGYWIWKPWIISQVLKSLKENQTLLYCDAGIILRAKAEYFEELAKDGLIHLWSATSHRSTNNYWIDKLVWNNIVGNGEVSKTPHYMAGIILSQNTQQFRDMVNRWLHLCENANLLRPDTKRGYTPSEGLIGHRHDQAILNCLVYLDSNYFSLTTANVDLITSPILIHRRGNLGSYHQALLLIYGGRIYRSIMRKFPRKVRQVIQKKIIRVRRPYTPEIEIERHMELFFNSKSSPESST
jgi:hypothetical protein